MWILVIAAVILCLICGVSVSNMFDFYSTKETAGGKNADDVSREILQSKGVYDILVLHAAGNLTDNFNPKTSTVNLSERVYGRRSISAVAVAAHETGPALQHADGYLFGIVRDAMVPVVNFASKAWVFIVLAGMFLGLMQLYTLGAIVFGVTLLFQIVTLPVEINASSLALRILSAEHYLTSEEMSGARKVLFAAAMTYVASALLSLAQFLRFYVRRR